jgi:hypothetical protein
MQRIKKTKPRFKVGDWVTFPWEPGKTIARIIEDRGPIGVGGRRLYRIERFWSEGEPDRFEMPEVELIAAPPPTTTAKAS